MDNNVHYEVEATNSFGTTMFLTVDGRFFTPYGKPIQYETEQEAFAALGRWYNRINAALAWETRVVRVEQAPTRTVVER